MLRSFPLPFKEITPKSCVKYSAFHCGATSLTVDKLDPMSHPMPTEFPCTHMIYKIPDYFPRIALVDSSDSYSYVFIYTRVCLLREGCMTLMIH